jgi:hypothetical protein
MWGGRNLDDEVLRHGLLALCAEVGDPAEDVQLRHVPGGTPGRNVVTDGAVAVRGPLAAVLGDAGDVDEVELVEAAVVHVVLVHEDDGAQSFSPR